MIVTPSSGLDLPTLANFIEGTQTDGAVSPAIVQVAPLFQVSISIPDAATQTYTYALASRYEIVDVTVCKQAAGAGNTIQVKDTGGNAISDAVAAAVDKTVTRAGTLDVAFNPRTGVTGFQITATRAAGSMACEVTITLRRRA